MSEALDMATTEEKEEQQKFADSHPIGSIIDSWTEWVTAEEKGDLEIDYDEDEDVFKIERDGKSAVIYTSDVDEAFYGESDAVIVEAEIGKPPENLDLSQTLKFSGQELVLSRISLTDRDEKTLLIVEAACPNSLIQPAHFDLMVKEVATIARDLRKHLSSVLEDEDDEEEDDDD